jgi:XTP/dITP diphosphohydrolase
MTTILVATRNRHKVGEIAAILGERFRYLDLSGFQEAPPVIEDEPTFAKNAVKKARELGQWLQGLPTFDFRVPGANALVVADDSGLEVDALNGAPGVHSARFAVIDASAGRPAGPGPKGNSSDADNNAKLLRLIKDVPLEKRAARFRCAIAAVRIKPRQPSLAGQVFDGVCEGQIQNAPRGKGGFGYDPLFVPLGHHQSFAELGPETKNKISHRAQALQKLRRYLDALGL